MSARLEFDAVVRTFRSKVGRVRAVDGVSLTVEPATTLALVGESGCGKSTMARLAARLLEPDSGEIRLDDQPAARIRVRAWRRHVQIVLQDPYASLDPRMTVQAALEEPLRIAGWRRKAVGPRVGELVHMVGLGAQQLRAYPHELSGGQRQRVAIARALAVEPDVLVLDEPASALDVSIQAQILNLLDSLQARLGLTMLFITHDLAVARHVADRVAVMYLGKVVEVGPAESVFAAVGHPYTQALLSAAPDPDPDLDHARGRIVLTGEPPSAVNPPSGCRFRTRCWRAEDRCAEEEPALDERGQGHPVACHFAGADGTSATVAPRYESGESGSR